MTEIDIVCRVFGEALHPSNHGEYMAEKTDAEFITVCKQLGEEMVSRLYAQGHPAEKIGDVVGAYLQALSHERQRFLPDPELEVKIGRRAAVWVKGWFNDAGDDGDNLFYLAAAHGDDKRIQNFMRQRMKEVRQIMRKESDLSPREIEAVCRILPDVYAAEVRKRAVHTPAQGEGSA